MHVLEPAFRNHLFSFGPADLAAHKNLMPCVIFGRTGVVRVRGDRQEISAPIVRIKPNVTHSVLIDEGGAEILYLDGLPSEPGLADFSELHSDYSDIPAAVKAEDRNEIDNFRQSLSPHAHQPDIEILKIIDRIYGAPMDRMTQFQLSARLGLERTQALKHFKINTGQTFRKFKLWAATVATVRGVMSGQNIGSAGIDSGFSDAAHVARTAKEIFGITPTNGIGAMTGFVTV